jgi:hypothetical protein
VPPDALQAPRQVGRHARRAEVVGDYPAQARRLPAARERYVLDRRPRRVERRVHAQRVRRGAQVLRLSKNGDEGGRAAGREGESLLMRGGR